ncbi:hypothetical protein SAMD00019534_098700 [Acytostelium subglobosum LB1]|uniref:hypothetical protein n=1 Tax=Acytostelium subglobosum LB1 TaxID=1410327 RepID=UPI000644D77E|nr:hypothetical protein SAMD00019534_098700 [Acytostelium subglobosum LB1]GAM26695.1 hypothetical protein SAMD00019534_098700 [Acytostelium subglobosum LB1]|eukprot:XP_012750356.1 hypothetical protein SAMD00019534_098700 [Acytostelium subglobosum LB1]
MADAIITQADQLHIEQKYAELLTLMEGAFKTYPDNDEITWRLARCYFDKVEEEKIANAVKIKEHAVRSLELKPNDPTTLHLLGRWCYSVANIGWAERTIASALFGTPPTATFQEALDYFLQADQQDPLLVRNVLYLGDTYAALKDNVKAKEYYVRVSKMQPRSEIEKAQVAEGLKKSK